MTNYFFAGLAITLLIIKYGYTLQARKLFIRSIGFNWIAWYSKEKIIGTHSNRFRNFLRISNRITIGVLLTIGIWGFAFLVLQIWGV